MRGLGLLIAAAMLLACKGKPVGAPKVEGGAGGSDSAGSGGAGAGGSGAGGESGSGSAGSDSGASGGASGSGAGMGGAGAGGTGGAGATGGSGDAGNGGACSAQCVSGCNDAGLCVPVVIYRGKSDGWFSRVGTRLDGELLYVASRRHPLDAQDELDIVAVPTAGGAALPVAERLRLDSYVANVPITLDDANIYFPAQNKLSAALRLFMVPKSGGTPVELGAVPDTWPSDMAQDTSQLYWLTDAVGVYQLAKAGGEATLVAPGVGTGSRLLLDGSTLIWGRYDAGVVVLQTLGEQPTSFTGNADTTCSLFGSAADLFWAECWWPYRIYSNRSGKTVELARAADPEPLRPPEGEGSVTADSLSLYFLEHGKLNRLPLAGGTPIPIGSTLYPDDDRRAADTIVGVDEAFVYLQGSDPPVLMRLPK